MAGKRMVFILALFVIIQTIHAGVNLNASQCSSISSLKIGVKDNECTKNADCHHARRICCENQETVSVCVEGVLLPVSTKDNVNITALSEPTNK